ncbi:hypothetical protein GCM10022225_36140 [Plantactinospora mayteni]|uniref:Uncharacterized protein n=1 Tax=Plantactinospora mayteni TaxID=566021 RepID=A0ABQ4EM42_9ACTN|nr:hypothetical protein [Plantactinospora mayteni]GIG95775.1 hypothetical protein Pma05_23480 [Plantactinospora mayteni]
MPLRRTGTVVAGGGVVAGLSIVDWSVLLALLAVGAMAVGAICWVVSDQERPERLALLIRSWRGQPEPTRPRARPVARRPSAAGARAAAPAARAAGTTDGR